MRIRLTLRLIEQHCEQDRFGGVIVQTDLTSFPRTVREFAQKLQDSLEHWKSDNASSVWLKFELPRHASVCIYPALCCIPTQVRCNF